MPGSSELAAAKPVMLRIIGEWTTDRPGSRAIPALHWTRASGQCMRSGRLAQGKRGALGTRFAEDVDPRAPAAYPSTMPATNQALPGGYALLNYRIDRQIIRGAFSIVYRAFDETGQPVAINEYLPSSLLLRTEGDVRRASSAENLTSFRYGMKCFFEEVRALAKINHPNVVRVLNFFRANET